MGEEIRRLPPGKGSAGRGISSLGYLASSLPRQRLAGAALLSRALTLVVCFAFRIDGVNTSVIVVAFCLFGCGPWTRPLHRT